MSKPHRAADHELPITTGYGVGDNRVAVFCGYCRDEFDADAVWRVRYMTARRDELTALKAAGTMTLAEITAATANLDQEEQRLIAILGAA